MQKAFKLTSLDAIDEVAKAILEEFKEYRLFTLQGDLGAGKTTLTQAFCRYLNVQEEVVSPTYTIINEYRNAESDLIYHADLYRLDTLEDAINTGIEDYLFSQQYGFVEWPQLISSILPYKFVKLVIKNNFDELNGRTIIAEANG